MGMIKVGLIGYGEWGKILFSKLNFFPTCCSYVTVLPERDCDDVRPTLVNKVNDRMFTIFSGRAGTCVSATKELIKQLNELR
jgi:hypothetical protein